jgi:hypothetical protein
MITASFHATATVAREPDAELLGPALAVFESLAPREEEG